MESENINTNGTSRLLLAIEMAILKYGREHSEFIQNPYQYFAKRLSYKSKNYIYKWFQPDRADVKIGFDDVVKILRITQDKILYEVAKEELTNVFSADQLKELK
jgi:hypothetical protein